MIVTGDSENAINVQLYDITTGEEVKDVYSFNEETYEAVVYVKRDGEYLCENDKMATEIIQNKNFRLVIISGKAREVMASRRTKGQ